MKKNLLFGILALVTIGIFAAFLVKNSHPSSKTQSTKPTSQKNPLPKEATVTLSKDGFSPKEITIKVGSAVRWKNDSGSQQTVNSDNYPTNQLHKELNFGIFTNNSSVVYTFTKPGIYGYHNQLQPTQKGTITVVK